MQYSLSKRLNYNKEEASPEVQVRSEFIKLAVSNLAYSEGSVSFRFHVSTMLPSSLTIRYNWPEEALVLVCNDIDQQDGFSTNFASQLFYRPSRPSSNLKTPPPLTLPEPTADELVTLSGAWVNGNLSFISPTPKCKPNIFLYIVLENYFSNVVGIDLFDLKCIYY